MTDFVEDFCELMKDEKLVRFRQKYIKDYSDIETVILWACLYEKMSKEYKDRYHQTIPNETSRKLFQFIFQDSNYRKKVIESFRRFQKENLSTIPFSPPKRLRALPI